MTSAGQRPGSVLVDTNILVYSAIDCPQHDAARGWLAARFADRDYFVGLSWASLFGFARLVSNRRVVGDQAVGVSVAWSSAQHYRRRRTARLLEPGEDHERLVTELLATPGLSSNDVPDAQLAALAIEHGVPLASHDHGFARFAGLRWFDPLAPNSPDVEG